MRKALSGRGNSRRNPSTVGLRRGTIWHWHDMVVVPHASAAWQHAFDDVTPEAALAFAPTGIGFTMTGVPLAQDSRADRRWPRLRARARHDPWRLLLRPDRLRLDRQRGQRPLQLAAPGRTEGLLLLDLRQDVDQAAPPLYARSWPSRARARAAQRERSLDHDFRQPRSAACTASSTRAN